MRVCFSLLALVLSGCASVSDRIDHARTLAADGNLQPVQIHAGAFTLQGWQRLGDPDQTMRVYIEGDGLAWVRPDRPSMNPTPREPVSLALAARDDHANVLYLARPCQYLGVGGNPECTTELWTHARFSPRVVNALDRALSGYAHRHGGLELVGFSGGGALAVLLAARRDDVRNLRTVAGNLDIVAFTEHHGVTPMSESLNPADRANALTDLPQIHFSGEEDSVVPTSVARSFAQALDDRRCLKIVTVKGARHREGWLRQWPALLDQPFPCSEGSEQEPAPARSPNAAVRSTRCPLHRQYLDRNQGAGLHV